MEWVGEKAGDDWWVRREKPDVPKGASWRDRLLSGKLGRWLEIVRPNPRSFSIRCLLTAGRMLESSGDPDEIGVDNLRLNLKSVGIRDRANSKIFHKFEEIISSVSFSILWIILEKEFSKERKSGRLRSSKERNTCNCNFSASVRICSESRGLHFSTSWKVYIYIYIYIYSI